MVIIEHLLNRLLGEKEVGVEVISPPCTACLRPTFPFSLADMLLMLSLQFSLHFSALWFRHIPQFRLIIPPYSAFCSAIFSHHHSALIIPFNFQFKFPPGYRTSLLEPESHDINQHSSHFNQPSLKAVLQGKVRLKFSFIFLSVLFVLIYLLYILIFWFSIGWIYYNESLFHPLIQN